MTAPRWAADLLDTVWSNEGTGSPPPLTWWRTSHRYSSGRACRDRIHVSAGRNRRDQRIVLLHEIAHALAGGQHHHDVVFWRVAWSVFVRYRGNVPLAALLRRESDMATSLTVADQLGIRGARAMAHARQRPKEDTMATTTTKARKAAPKATTKPPRTAARTSSDTKRCPGVPKAGRQAHDNVPLTDFAANASRPDGRSTWCRECRKAYAAWKRAAKAAAAEPTTEAPAEPAPAGPVAAEPFREAPAVKRRRLLHERQLAKVGGAGTDAGQALLARWHDEEMRDRAATRRAMRVVAGGAA